MCSAVRVTGREGLGSFINGVYRMQPGQFHDNMATFRHVTGIPLSVPGCGGKPLFLCYSASNVAWALLHLGYIEGGKRFIQSVANVAIEAFRSDPYIQHQGNFGWSLMGLAPERTDLIAQVRTPIGVLR